MKIIKCFEECSDKEAVERCMQKILAYFTKKSFTPHDIEFIRNGILLTVGLYRDSRRKDYNRIGVQIDAVDRSQIGQDLNFLKKVCRNN